MKRLITTLILILSACYSFAQDITGDWYGVLHDGSNLRINFHVKKTADTYTTTLDSPDQGANGLPTDKTTVTGNQIKIEASQFHITYTGTYLPDSNKINGSFNQGMATIQLNLSHKPIVVAIRPQDPKDFPYKQEEVVFTNAKAGNKLAGTLTMPSTGKVSKIVVLIAGSGPLNRNEELPGINHRPFLVWSDWLTRNGIAVLRYDKRGIDKSTGSFAASTTTDFADDVTAAVNYIQSRADLKNLSIGLIGHSEGGLIAPVVASQNPAVKFIVLLAGPGIPVSALMIRQNEDQMRLRGVPDSLIQRATETNKKLYALIIKNPALSAPQLKQQIDILVYQDARAHSHTPLDEVSKQNIAAAYAPLVSPWYRYFIAFNPENYLTRIKCPVLALNGTMDMQVNSTANLAGIKASLLKAGNKNYEIVPLQGLNHLFQKASIGSVAEYAEISETVNPVALQKASDWIKQLHE